MISVSGLYKSFTLGGKTLSALQGVDLKVERGEFLCIMGPSGAGKSTLMHILGALDHPTSGEVTIDGQNLFALPEADLPRIRSQRIGFVFQFHYLLSEFTAIENVMMPLRIGGRGGSEGQAWAESLLSKVGLAERMHHKPGELSGGEQQRVAVARALAMKPGLVLADEPTGNLDTHTGRELFNLLRRFNRDFGTTFVFVTHNETLGALCDRIVRMVDGRIVSG